MSTQAPTKPRAKRAPAASDAVRPDPGGMRATATAWLAHPLSSLYLIGVPTALLLAFGTVMVWSASSVFATERFKDANYFLFRQLIFVVVGLVGLYIVQRIPMSVFRRLGWLIFAAAVGLMIVPLVHGKEIKGNKNWIDFGIPMLRFQPSELAKIVIILWGAAIFTHKRRTLSDARHLLIPFVPGALALIALTLLQHDLGTAMIMGMIVLVMLWNVGGSVKVLLGLGGLVTAGVIGLVVFGASRMARITGFLDPNSDLSGINYQPSQAQFGLASGGWWGVGLGYGRMKWGYLSESHTDYILAVIGEECGLIGTLAVLALLLLLTYGGFRAALRTDSFYARTVASGISCWFGFQALVNIFVVLRLLPVMGVPLPLVSYGGSSLVVNLAAIGVLLRVAKEEPETRAVLARRKNFLLPKARLSAVMGGRRRRA